MPRAVRAIMANAVDPSAIIRDLNAAFGDFRTRNDNRLGTIESSIDDLATRITAANLNGGMAGFTGRANAAIRSAFGSFVKSGGMGELNALGPQAAMTTESGPDGGFLVPDEIAGEIIALQRPTVAMRSLARVVPIASSGFRQPFSKHGSASGWVGESEARPTTTPPILGFIDVQAHEVYANPSISQSLLDDAAINVADFVLGEIAGEFNAQEGDAFLNGSGIKKPRGLLTYPIEVTGDATRQFGHFQYVPSGDADSLKDDPDGLDALRKLVYTVRAGYRANAWWLMNSTTAGILANLKDGQGRYQWSQAVAPGLPPTLFGYPVAFDEGMPDIGANAYPVAFGDFKRGYLIADRLPVRTLRDALTNKPFVQFYTTKRVGGGALDSLAIKFLKIAAG